MNSHKDWFILPKVFAAAVFCLVIYPGNSVFAAEGEKVIVLSEKVGEVIDREERDYFRMFQAYEGFKSAVFLELPDSSYVAEITYEADGEEQMIRLPQSAESIESLRNYIDNYEEISSRVFGDNELESPGEMIGVLCVPDSNHIQILATVDGSMLVGRIVEITERDVKFESKLGTLIISISDIREIKEIAISAIKEGTYWFPNPNATRLFFAATGRSLKEGEGYFADYYLFFPVFAYGITDNITIAGGMSLLPTGKLEHQLFYFMPKVGIIQKEGGALSAGIMMLKLPDFGDEAGPAVGIAYGVGTLGGSNASLTGGLGYGYVDWDFADTPMIMIGGEKRISRRVALVSENWWLPGLDTPLISGGIRFFGEKLCVDLALIQVLEHLFFPGMPYIDFVVKF